MARPDVKLDGFLIPGHVITVAGTSDYERLACDTGKPMVVAGFEPLDMLHGLWRWAELALNGRAEVRNAYPRAVRQQGNTKAQEVIDQVFSRETAEWRGLGAIPESGAACG